MEEIGHTLALAVWGNHGPTIVHWEESPQAVTVNLRLGDVMPLLSSATGRCFAAYAVQGSDRAAAEGGDRAGAEAGPHRRARLAGRSARAMLDDVRAARRGARGRHAAARHRGLLRARCSTPTAISRWASSRSGPTGTFDPAWDGAVDAPLRAAAAQLSQRPGLARMNTAARRAAGGRWSLTGGCAGRASRAACARASGPAAPDARRRRAVRHAQRRDQRRPRSHRHWRPPAGAAPTPASHAPRQRPRPAGCPLRAGAADAATTGRRTALRRSRACSRRASRQPSPPLARPRVPAPSTLALRGDGAVPRHAARTATASCAWRHDGDALRGAARSQRCRLLPSRVQHSTGHAHAPRAWRRCASRTGAQRGSRPLRARRRQGELQQQPARGAPAPVRRTA